MLLVKKRSPYRHQRQSGGGGCGAAITAARPSRPPVAGAIDAAVVAADGVASAQGRIVPQHTAGKGQRYSRW